ncbi:TonB-dependent receptor [Phenylobacterium sp.]|uniref:TonB-dependent receptor n=1 Tax=Phenylobacterium sp. TaxID=1871053 RepID=UPI0030021DBC
MKSTTPSGHRRRIAMPLRTALLVTAMSGVAGAALAQASSGPVDLDEVVVTASKRGAASVQEIPYNISAVGEEQLQKTGAATLDDIVRQVPGISTMGGQGNKTVIIRGLAASAGAPQVGIYLDETPLTGIGGTNVRQSDIGLYDIERIEVLRGPQGTLYGAGSQGGTLRYITNKPETTGGLSGAVGTKIATRARDGGERLEGHAVINVPIVEDMFAVRALAYGRTVDGFVDMPLLEIEGSDKEKVEGGRFQAMLDLPTRTNILGSMVYQRARMDDSSQTLRDTDSRPLRALEPYLDELRLYNLTVEQEVGVGTITATVSSYDRKTRFVFDQSQFVSPRFGSINQTTKTNALTGELRFASDFDGPVQVVTGLFYENRDSDAISLGAFVNDPNGLIDVPAEPFFAQPSDQHVLNRAAFFNAMWDVTEKLSIEGGVRYFKMQRRNETSLIFDVFGRPLGPQPSQSAVSDGNALKAQASYEFTDDILGYAIYSEGFREGGPNAPGLLGNYPLSFDPDFVKNYELGWKSTVLDRQLQLNGAVYLMKWDDIQVSQRDPTGAFNYTSNAGKAELKGIELEGRLRPNALPGFSANFAVRRSDQKLTEDNPLVAGPPANPLAGLEGERIPNTSKWGGNLGVEQTFTMFGLDAYARADASYTGEAFTTFSPNDPIRRAFGDYTLVDLRSGVQTGTWEASIYVRNLFNERALTGWNVQSRPGIPDLVRTTEPRELGIQLGYNF